VRMSSIVLTVVLVSGAPGWAQTTSDSSSPTQKDVDGIASPGVDIGMRVRLHTSANVAAPEIPPFSAALIGEVVAIDQDRFVLKLDGRPLEVTVPRSAIGRIERSQGKVRVGSRVKSALKGLALGAAAGWLLGEAFPTCRVGGTDPFCDANSGPTDGRAKDKSNPFAAWFGVAGGAAGAYFGSRMVEDWKEVVPARAIAPRFEIAARRNGAKVAFRVSF